MNLVKTPLHLNDIFFCHTGPTSLLHYTNNQPVHMILAHMIDEDINYRQFYYDLKKSNENVFYHLDNSTYEMYIRGLPPISIDDLLKIASLINADSVILPDFPGEDWFKTVDIAKKYINKIKENGYYTCFCPQSVLGDISGLLQSYEWAINNPYIDFIGVSILACPIAYGYQYLLSKDIEKIHVYLSRWAIFRLLDERGFLNESTIKKFHCFGLFNGPREIEILREYHKYIFSWDSFIPIWNAIHGIIFDDSPTGLRYGKDIDQIDYNKRIKETSDISFNIISNINYISKLCEKL